MKQLVKIIGLSLFCLYLWGFDSAIESRISRGIELANNDNLIEALEEFKDLGRTLPDHPMPFFFQVAAIEKIQADYMTDYKEDDFEALLENGINTARTFIKNNPENAEGYYFLGALQGYGGLHSFRTSNRITVFVDALKSLSNLSKARSLDPGLYDTFYGDGCYYYWKPVKAPFLYLFKNSRQHDKMEGIRCLELTAERGKYGKEEAKGALIRVLINEHRMEDALKLIGDNLSKYPRSLANLRYKQAIHFEMNDWPGVYEDSSRMERLLKDKVFTGPEAWIELYYFKGVSSDKLNRTDEALSNYRTVVKLSGIYKKRNITNKTYLDFAKKRVAAFKKLHHKKIKEYLYYPEKIKETI